MMTSVVGARSVHGSVWSSKMQATLWAGLVTYGMGTYTWTRAGRFLGGQSSIGVLQRLTSLRDFKVMDNFNVVEIYIPTLLGCSY